ncbi:MAG: transcription factor TFIIIC complex A box associated subunit Sfc1 [Amphiamblys sp. WSBS2006]|nr:MAG: transcription factor TFIIIC complex A box associated subunit Sfc1 [Amphiamblys sp. WSBS2006]
MEKETSHGTIRRDKLYLLEFPGIVRDEEKALELLQGENNIKKEFQKEHGEIDFRPRKTDPFSHPLTGRIDKARLILLFEKEGCSVMEKTCSFSGLFDLQYRPSPQKEAAVAQALEKLDPMDTQTLRNMARELGLDKTHVLEDTTDVMPPPVLCTHRIPFFSRARTRSPLGKPPTSSYLVTFDCPFPKTEIGLPKTPSEHLPALRRLFQERSIATRTYITEKLPFIEKEALKDILPYCAVYYNNGPWRGCWAKRDFNPKTDPNTRHYQTVFIKGTLLEDIGDPLFRTKDRFVFDGKKLSSEIQLLQYCDLTDPAIRVLIDSAPIRAEPSFVDGWLPDRTKIRLKAAIREKIKEILLGFDLAKIDAKHHQKIKTYLYAVEKLFTPIKKKGNEEYEILESD